MVRALSEPRVRDRPRVRGAHPIEPTAEPLRLPRLLEAAREFNAGRFFEAHEALEEGLDEVPDELWDLALGLIQIAVGYHKLTEGFAGAGRMLGLGLGKVAPYSAVAGGVDLEPLRSRVRSDLELLLANTLDLESLRRHPPLLLPK